jgi:hypothetical protein
LFEPFTFTLSRLIDKPSYDPSKGNPATAGKVLLVDVWKSDGTPVFSEQGHMDANAAAGVIVRINQHLTGQAVLTPRQPKAKSHSSTHTPTTALNSNGDNKRTTYPNNPSHLNSNGDNNSPNNPDSTWGQSAPVIQPQPAPQPQVIGGLTPEQMQQFNSKHPTSPTSPTSPTNFSTSTME